MTTGLLVSSRHMEGIYEILNHMTQDNLWTHQLPRANEECKPWLIRWYPSLDHEFDSEPLAKFIAESTPTDGCAKWVEQIRKATGLPQQLEVWPIPRDDHQHKNPWTEAIEMVGPDRVIAVIDEDRQP